MVNESVTVVWEENSGKLFLTAFDIQGNEFYSKQFSRPELFEIDLDSDGNNELIIIDSSVVNGLNIFETFVYSTLDTFYLVDSVLSALIPPSIYYSEETESFILTGGDSDFLKFINSAEEFPSVPVSVWKYEEGELFNINDEVYELFIITNENLIKILDNFEPIINEDCTETKKFTSVIVSIYVNFMRANETSNSQQFMKKYYLCPELSKIFNTLNYSE